MVRDGVVGDGFETGITSDDRMVVWGLTGTSTLGSATSTAALDHAVVQTLSYAKLARSLQKPGPTPSSIASTSGSTASSVPTLGTRTALTHSTPAMVA